MDGRLVAWARAVKARQPRKRGRRLPALWLFTDTARLADPLPAAASLPPGLCGVVLRHDAHPRRLEVGMALAGLCRRRRLVLAVAGDWRLAWRLRALLHIRGGRWPSGARRGTAATSSAHGVAELVRAQRRGVDLVFLSPAFRSDSHPGAPGLGPLRWGALAARAGEVPVAALGGVNGTSCRSLPPLLCAGAGAIGAVAG